MWTSLVYGMLQKGLLVLTYSPGGIQAGGEGAGCVAWLRVDGGASGQDDGTG